MFSSVFVCLSVCLLARLLKNACMDLDEMLRVDRCRDVDELINFLSPIWITVRMLEPDCILRYCISAAMRNFITSGKSHVYVLAACRCSEVWL